MVGGRRRGRPASRISPAGGADQPGDGVERRRLAGAVRPHQRDDLLRAHLEGHVVDRADRAVADGEGVDLEMWRGRPAPAGAAGRLIRGPGDAPSPPRRRGRASVRTGVEGAPAPEQPARLGRVGGQGAVEEARCSSGGSTSSVYGTTRPRRTPAPSQAIGAPPSQAPSGGEGARGPPARPGAARRGDSSCGTGRPPSAVPWPGAPGARRGSRRARRRRRASPPRPRSRREPTRRAHGVPPLRFNVSDPPPGTRR